MRYLGFLYVQKTTTIAKEGSNGFFHCSLLTLFKILKGEGIKTVEKITINNIILGE